MTTIDFRPRPALRAAPPSGASRVEPDRPMPGRSGSGLIDRLPCGIAIVSREGRVRVLNAAAREAIVAGRHGLRLDGDRLRAETCRAAETWDRALCEAVGGRSRFVRLGDALPIGVSGWSDGDGDGRGAAACTFAGAPERLETLARAYGALHGLTEGETDVLHGLVVGLEPKRIAGRRGSTEATVRSQIKTVLAKSGCHGLRDLVGSVLRQPPLLERPDDDRAPQVAGHVGRPALAAVPASVSASPLRD